MRLKLGQTELAEADFREAIALAQKMQAKAWELRATMSLARLLDTQGRRDAAPRDARRNLRLVHRRLRYRRPEGRQGSPRPTERLTPLVKQNENTVRESVFIPLLLSI